jgi:cytochrome c oxidase subunit 3
MPDQKLILREPFREIAQQREADALGMWVFLATEAIMFGGLFFALIVIRALHSEGAREATRELNMWLGGLNSAVLLVSSLTTALAVGAARSGARRVCARYVLASAAPGAAFLVVKGFEYYSDYLKGLIPGLGEPFPIDAPGAEFISGYFASTGLHAIHLTIGIGVVLILASLIATGRLGLPERDVVVELAGRYWQDLNRFGRIVTLGLPALQAVLLLWHFMELRSATALTRLVAVAAFFWLALLFGLGLSDWLTR